MKRGVGNLNGKLNKRKIFAFIYLAKRKIIYYIYLLKRMN